MGLSKKQAPAIPMMQFCLVNIPFLETPSDGQPGRDWFTLRRATCLCEEAGLQQPQCSDWIVFSENTEEPFPWQGAKTGKSCLCVFFFFFPLEPMFWLVDWSIIRWFASTLHAYAIHMHIQCMYVCIYIYTHIIIICKYTNMSLYCIHVAKVKVKRGSNQCLHI